MSVRSQPQHSRLVQRSIRSAKLADREFARVKENNEIPIVLVVKRFPMLFQFAVAVPSGPYVLYQRWHEDQGQLEPGVRWFWPFYYRISHIVTQAAITYNAPARKCPTADNIMVNIDLSLTFRIGPDVEAAKNFVYRLGAHRFDELLSAETEENIRGLVFSVTHDRVHDLKEEFAVGMLSVLNAKVNHYGVQVLTVKITDVTLPTVLQQRLESTTAFKTKMGETEKTHENYVRVLTDEATKTLEKIRKTNARKIQELVAEHERFDIQRLEMETRARGNARLREISVETKAAVLLSKAKGNEEIATIKARQEAASKLKEAEVSAQKMRLDANKQATNLVTLSEAALRVAEYTASGLIAQAEAEAEGADALTEKRKYELEWSRLGVLENIAGSGRRFITGQHGQEILNNLVPTSTM